MTASIKIEDIKFVNAELRKLLTAGTTLNDWETKFVRDIGDLIDVDTALSKKQIFYLYRTYFQRVEDDMDAFEDWCDNFGFRIMWQENQYDRS